jgi:hypothetical protein
MLAQELEERSSRVDAPAPARISRLELGMKGSGSLPPFRCVSSIL